MTNVNQELTPTQEETKIRFVPTSDTKRRHCPQFIFENLRVQVDYTCAYANGFLTFEVSGTLEIELTLENRDDMLLDTIEVEFSEANVLTHTDKGNEIWLSIHDDETACNPELDWALKEACYEVVTQDQLNREYHRLEVEELCY